MFFGVDDKGKAGTQEILMLMAGVDYKESPDQEHGLIQQLWSEALVANIIEPSEFPELYLERKNETFKADESGGGLRYSKGL